VGRNPRAPLRLTLGGRCAARGSPLCTTRTSRAVSEHWDNDVGQDSIGDGRQIGSEFNRR
jgi:hypothetical protein